MRQAQDYGTWPVGSTWYWLFQIWNRGTTPLTISAMSITGPSAADFWIDPAGCQPQINPNDFCLLNVAFAPTSIGPKSATLQLVDNAPGSPHAVALTGTGSGAPTVTTIEVSPDPAPAGGAVTWTATVAPNPGGGAVDFVLDGFEDVAGCQQVPLRADGTASCALRAPSDPGRHFARATFTGFGSFLPSLDDVPFRVRTAPAPPPAPTPVPATPTGTPTPDGGAPGGGDDAGPGAPAGRARGASVVAPVRLSPRGRGVLTVRCPAGRDCTVAGSVRARRAPGATPPSARGPRIVLARFAGIEIPAGRSRRIPFAVPRAWLDAARRQGVRRVRAIAGVRTALDGGGTRTNRQLVALSLPGR
ncbi:MAG: choice-of-anchor D domain-containing protein [Solirubrobacteraceae bacterium]|nr:choice-of-anchor D domain-containing protein [Solirubrobacteraceae bacterium]